MRSTIMSTLLRDSPAALEGVERLIASLVWAARLFVVTVQRGLRVIWAAAGRNAPVKENLLTFALELACLVAVVAVLAAAQAARLLAAASGGSTSRLERALFLEPERLMRAYGRRYSPGQTIFEVDTTGREAYFVHLGKIGVYAPDGVRVGTINPGEVFGEMAFVLDETRTATVRAEEESLVLAIPPEVFSIYIKADAEANRRLVAQLSARLKDVNSRLHDAMTNEDSGD